MEPKPIQTIQTQSSRTGAFQRPQRWIFVCLVLLLGAALYLSLGQNQAVAGSRKNDAGVSFQILLPSILRNSPIRETIFGIEADSLTTNEGLEQIDDAGARWVRRNAVFWHAVEPNEGDRVWSVLNSLSAELMEASRRNLKVILIVRSTPAWAQATPGYFCGTIKPEKLAAFGDFMYDLVSRYSAPPYNVKYWELWNEPDVAPFQVDNGESVFGCWGDENDPNFGGDAYADMLAAVYPRVKAADPEAQVLVGGLLLNCDPNLPNACPPPLGNKTSRFLRGILSHHGANDGKNYFDGISFHAYDFYYGSPGDFENPLWGSGSESTGPVIYNKTDFIRSELSSFNATGITLINTETALICDTCVNNQGFEFTKANYLAQSYATALAKGLEANIWFSIFGWRNSGLIYPDFSTRLAYDAFLVARSALLDSSYLGEVSSGDLQGNFPIRGYKFNRGDRKVWVLWATDGSPHQVSLPSVPLLIYDTLGTWIPTTQNPVITQNPYYVEFAP